jgi:hypothetical protein
MTAAAPDIALTQYLRGFARRTGARWRVELTKPNGRVQLRGPRGVQATVYYRRDRGRWEQHLNSSVRALVRAQRGSL